VVRYESPGVMVSGSRLVIGERSRQVADHALIMADSFSRSQLKRISERIAGRIPPSLMPPILSTESIGDKGGQIRQPCASAQSVRPRGADGKLPLPVRELSLVKRK
jgi:hypothetical protein